MKLPSSLPRWSDLLVGLLLLHILWGAARIPGKVWGERLDDVAQYRRVGPAAYHLGNRYRSGAAAVEQVLATTPEQAVLLWRGDWRNALEFVPPLIAPRLLVNVIACPPGTTTYLGRPVATGRLSDGRSGVLVLIGQGESVALEVRPR